jgi:hypothetical protein
MMIHTTIKDIDNHISNDGFTARITHSLNDEDSCHTDQTTVRVSNARRVTVRVYIGEKPTLATWGAWKTGPARVPAHGDSKSPVTVSQLLLSPLSILLLLASFSFDHSIIRSNRHPLPPFVLDHLAT